MTGITRDELMQMAIAHGFKRTPVVWHHLSADQDEVIAFTNAILERAAVECKKVEDFYWHLDSVVGATACIQIIRALKINTGD